MPNVWCMKRPNFYRDDFIHVLSLQFIKFKHKSEKTKERNKVNIHAETIDLVNIENPLSFCS